VDYAKTGKYFIKQVVYLSNNLKVRLFFGGDFVAFTHIHSFVSVYAALV